MSKKDKKAYKKQKKQRALEMANGEFDQEQNKNKSLVGEKERIHIFLKRSQFN